ncbi:MAG: TSUP family transporter, partial [Candidatus Nanopelagicales bacterium]
MPAAGARDVGVGAGAGVVSGLFGVGGGIVLVPYLVLARGWDQKQAQATSLVMV